MTVGEGARPNKFNNFSEECKKRRGIITIKNNDDSCLPLALVVSIANIEKDPAFSKIRKDTGKIQTQRAKELIKNAQRVISENGTGISELEKYQIYFKDYKIVVDQYGVKRRDIIFEKLMIIQKI
ncbi:hypothetical protein JTB14_024789 [Gonioctena quinquepunctata]|nr:hypothetical protein JTB14_024789 [Gonioctena quinquepunctata]